MYCAFRSYDYLHFLFKSFGKSCSFKINCVMSDCAFGTNFSLAFKDYEPQMQHRICIDERLLLQRFHHNSISFPMVGLLHLSYPMMPFSERRKATHVSNSLLLPVATKKQCLSRLSNNGNYVAFCNWHNRIG